MNGEIIWSNIPIPSIPSPPSAYDANDVCHCGCGKTREAIEGEWESDEPMQRQNVLNNTTEFLLAVTDEQMAESDESVFRKALSASMQEFGNGIMAVWRRQHGAQG